MNNLYVIIENDWSDDSYVIRGVFRNKSAALDNARSLFNNQNRDEYRNQFFVIEAEDGDLIMDRRKYEVAWDSNNVSDL